MFEGFETKRIEVEGIGIHLRQAGSGPPLLLLHGYPQTHVEWHKVAPSLAEHFTVVCPDLRGYGDSDKPLSSDGDLSTYCKRAMANDQLGVMRALGFEHFQVVGHDRGVRVGLRMALDHPDAIQSLTNLDVVPSQEAFEAMDSSLAFSWFHWHLMRQPKPFPETLIGANPKFYLDFLLDSWTSIEGAIIDEAYAEYLRCFSNPDTIRATCADYRSLTLDLEHDEIDRGRKLACPVLVLWGGVMPKRPGWQTGDKLDMMTVWTQRADNIHGKGLDCGHFIPEERPDALVSELISFLRRE
tara:strand:- start:860 stop:1753 length:894 start_codon:yes stop_codon:yes gene_type:complete